jgi:hypothetical protein
MEQFQVKNKNTVTTVEVITAGEDELQGGKRNQLRLSNDIMIETMKVQRRKRMKLKVEISAASERNN